MFNNNFTHKNSHWTEQLLFLQEYLILEPLFFPFIFHMVWHVFYRTSSQQEHGTCCGAARKFIMLIVNNQCESYFSKSKILAVFFFLWMVLKSLCSRPPILVFFPQMLRQQCLCPEFKHLGNSMLFSCINQYNFFL